MEQERLNQDKEVGRLDTCGVAAWLMALGIWAGLFAAIFPV